MASSSLLYHKNTGRLVDAQIFPCLLASGWRNTSTRLIHSNTVVTRTTDEPLAKNWLNAARGVERLVQVVQKFSVHLMITNTERCK
jgi:hypothetical protein